jgi:hypothetical protein
MAWWQLTGKPPVIQSGTVISFWASPQDFIAMAQAAGLHFVRSWQHDDPDTRNNYLFRS